MFLEKHSIILEIGTKVFVHPQFERTPVVLIVREVVESMEWVLMIFRNQLYNSSDLVTTIREELIVKQAGKVQNSRVGAKLFLNP